MKHLIVAACAAFLLVSLVPREAFAHGGGLNKDGCHRETATGGYHCHRGGSRDDGGQEGDEDSQSKRICEAARADGKRDAEAWNNREAAAWAHLQKMCANESPVSEYICEYHSQVYQESFSPEAAAEFPEYLLGRIAEACAPPKSREEVQCEHLARAIEGARSRRNDKGIAYWTQRATEAGCT